MIPPPALSSDPDLGNSAARRGPSLTLFCYALNEERLIEKFLRKSVHDLQKVTDDFEIVFHNDGSTDRTLEIAQAVALELAQIKIWDNGRNRGVGFCYRETFGRAAKDWLFVNTVDEFWNTEDLGKFLPHLADGGIVAGVRLQRKHCYGLWRQILSWTNYYLIRFLFGLKLRDFQNVHFYPRGFVSQIPLESTSTFTSPEILIKARALGLPIVEVPMQFQPRKEGKAKGARLKNLIHSAAEIFRFWFRWEILGEKARFTAAYSEKIKLILSK